GTLAVRAPGAGGRQRQARTADLAGRQPRLGVGDPDQRGADGRPARGSAAWHFRRRSRGHSAQEHEMTLTAPEKTPHGPLAKDELQKLDAYWRAANYLSVGQIYLLDNPL